MDGTPADVAVCLMGPTATGKTAVSLALARRFPVTVISVDSAMVYRGMDIGSGKPSIAERGQVPHRLIDIRDPWQTYSAGEFAANAASAIQEALAAGRVPLLVGGTFLYFRSLMQGLSRLPTADAEVRRRLDQRGEALGWPALHRELAAVDPPAAARIKPGDRQRIQRALEVYELTGRPLSELQGRASPPTPFRFLRIAILPVDRERLHLRIETRFQAMLEAGFIAEVEGLMARPEMHDAVPALRAVGYRQLWQLLRGETSEPEALRRALTATRQLARRQLTWLRQERCEHALDMEAPDLVADIEQRLREPCRLDALSGPNG